MDPSKVAGINFSNTTKTARPVDSSATASTSRESEEVWILSFGHLVKTFIDNTLLQSRMYLNLESKLRNLLRLRRHLINLS